MKLIKKIKALLRKTLNFVMKRFGWLLPIDKKLIVFTAFHGRGYLDNPKYIHLQMMKDERFKDYKTIWFVKKGTKIPGVKTINYLSLRYFYYVARAKVWIFNCKMPTYLHKKSNQIYIQTWHGTPLKRLGCDIETKEGQTFYRSKMSGQEMKETYRIDSAKYNYMISPSQFTTDVFPSAFDVAKERLLEVGYPRNDILINYTQQQVDDLKEQLHIPKDKKVLLYAPTWRDNNFTAKGYQFELEVNFDLWKKYLSDDYVVLFKPHYLIVTKFDFSAYKGFVYNIPPTKDIAALYPLADVLVTDYSSVFFDYALMKRPIYFYMYDLDSYKDELRGFYIDIHQDLPGDIYESEEIMLEAIKNEAFDYERLETFSKRFNSNEDGKAAQKILDVLYQDLKK